MNDKPRIIKLHGYNVSDGGRATVDMLDPHLTDYDYRDLDYGHFNLIDVRLKNKDVAFALIMQTHIKDQEVWLGHSNGSAIIFEALQKVDGVRKRFSDKSRKWPLPKGIILINPALDSDIEFPEGDYFIHIYYSPSDDPTWWAKWLFRHPWGSMGRDGYTGKQDPRIKQWNEMDLLGKNIEHSGVFKPANVEAFSKIMIENLETELKDDQ